MGDLFHAEHGTNTPEKKKIALLRVLHPYICVVDPITFKNLK